MFLLASSAARTAANASIHHVGRRNDIGAGSSVTLRLLCQHLYGLVVEHVPTIVDQPILSVCRVRVECNVRHHAKFGELLLEFSHHTRHETLRVVRLARIQAFQWCIDHRENRHDRNAKLHALLGILEQQVQSLALDPRHGLHILGFVAAFKNKNGINEICRSEYMLSHKVA